MIEGKPLIDNTFRAIGESGWVFEYWEIEGRWPIGVNYLAHANIIRCSLCADLRTVRSGLQAGVTNPLKIAASRGWRYGLKI